MNCSYKFNNSVPLDRLEKPSCLEVEVEEEGVEESWTDNSSNSFRSQTIGTINRESLFNEAVRSIYELKIEEKIDESGLPIGWCKEMIKEEKEFENDLDKINLDSYIDLNELVNQIELEDNLNNRFDELTPRLGLVSRPFCLHLSNNLWGLINMDQPTFPSYMKSSVVNLLQSDPKCLDRLYELENIIKSFKDIWIKSFDNNNNYSLFDEEIEFAFKTLKYFLIEFMTPRDLGLMLGLFETEGSLLKRTDPSQCIILMPSIQECLLAFSKYHVTKGIKSPTRKGIKPTRLTSGARALTKHYHRDRTTYFWPQCNGTEEKKNRLANEMLVKIFSDLAWVNLHSLPGDKPAFELRNSLGFGGRWEMVLEYNLESQLTEVKDVIFRGLLEPQMIDGHSSNWIH